MLKKVGKIVFTIFGALIVLAVAFYGFYLTPQKRAATHLEFVHKTINEMHPAILEADATEFQEWHQRGYEQAKKMLPMVKTEGDVSALMRFYLAGYKDSHLGGAFTHTPYSRIDSEDRSWTGWIVKATPSGYFVQFAKQGEQYPQVNAQLLECDKKPIDTLLQEHFSPYLDRRWQILQARHRAAQALSYRNNGLNGFNRPAINECTFDNNGEKKSYPLTWQPIEESEREIIRAANISTYKLPSVKKLSPDLFWITASDFQLNSPNAAKHQQQLLKDIISLPKESATIVLDTRGNGGGSSSHGFRIVDSLFKQDRKSAIYLNKIHQYKIQNSNALFRASKQLYWSYDQSLREAIANQGQESTDVKHTERFLARLKVALDNGEQTLYQKEHPTNTTLSSEPVEKWDSTIKIVLITDRTCVSACLDFVDLLKLIPNLLHLGEPTNADTAYTQVAHMENKYFKETFNFIVPVKKWNKRLREDNQPYVPNTLYEGDIYNDEALEEWVLTQAEQHFGKPH